MKRREAIVIGGGAMGAAVLHALGRKGVKSAALFEAGAPGAGASGVSPGVVRVYHSDWYLANLAGESFAQFERLLGHERSGALYFDPEWKLARLRQEVGRLNGRGSHLEILTFTDGRERFPSLRWREGEFAVFEPRAGCVDPKAAIRAWLADAEVFADTPVDAILMRGHRAAGVVAAGKEIEADHVVLCAGAASADLLAPLGIDLPMRTRAVEWQRFRVANSSPSTPIVFDRRGDALARPWEEGEFVVGNFEAAAARMPSLEGAELRGGARTRETVAEDGRGIAMAAPGARNLVVATGWSGFSLSVVPAVARRIAEMLG